MSRGAWSWNKTDKEPDLPKKVWTAGSRVRYNGMDDRFDGVIQQVFKNYLLIMTDYGFRTCVNLYDAEECLEVM